MQVRRCASFSWRRVVSREASKEDFGQISTVSLREVGDLAEQRKELSFVTLNDETFRCDLSLSNRTCQFGSSEKIKNAYSDENSFSSTIRFYFSLKQLQLSLDQHSKLLQVMTTQFQLFEYRLLILAATRIGPGWLPRYVESRVASRCCEELSRSDLPYWIGESFGKKGEGADCFGP